MEASRELHKLCESETFVDQRFLAMLGNLQVEPGKERRTRVCSQYFGRRYRAFLTRKGKKTKLRDHVQH
jgi:hypothetical protein